MAVKRGTSANDSKVGDFGHKKKKKMNLKRANSDMNNCG